MDFPFTRPIKIIAVYQYSVRFDTHPCRSCLITHQATQVMLVYLKQYMLNQFVPAINATFHFQVSQSFKLKHNFIFWRKYTNTKTNNQKTNLDLRLFKPDKSQNNRLTKEEDYIKPKLDTSQRKHVDYEYAIDLMTQTRNTWTQSKTGMRNMRDRKQWTRLDYEQEYTSN